MAKKDSQTFNDGMLIAYRTKNVAEPGDQPLNKIQEKGRLRYEKLKVGLNRYWTGKQNNVEIAMFLRVPDRFEINPQDIIVPNDGFQYEVKQAQPHMVLGTPCTDLSLARTETDYELAPI